MSETQTLQNQIPPEIKSLIEELKPKQNEIVIVHHVHRSSESYYNHKTIELIIIYKESNTSYEEPDVREIKTINIYTGWFQEYDIHDIEEAIKVLKNMGFIVKRVEI